MKLFIMTARSLLTGSIEYVVGVFTDRKLAVEMSTTLKDEIKGISFSVHEFGLNTPYLQNKQVFEPVKTHVNIPDYLTKELSDAIKLEGEKIAANRVLNKFVSKVLTELSDCADNPEIVRDYINGLQKGVEDFI